MPSKCFSDRQSLETSFYVDSWHEFMALYCATCMLVLTLLFGVPKRFLNCVKGYLTYDECLRSNRMRQKAVALHRCSSSCKSRVRWFCVFINFCDESFLLGRILPFLRFLFSHDYFRPRFCRNIRKIVPRQGNKSVTLLMIQQKFLKVICFLRQAN